MLWRASIAGLASKFGYQNFAWLLGESLELHEYLLKGIDPDA
jgi:hypothetical protein